MVKIMLVLGAIFVALGWWVSRPAFALKKSFLSDPGTVGWLRFIFFMLGLLFVGFSQVLRARS